MPFFNFGYMPQGLFGGIGNRFSTRQMPQMGMQSYIPPYLSQYMQQYGMPMGMQGIGQRMPPPMMPMGMPQYSMPQYPMQQQGVPMGMGGYSGMQPQPVSNEYAPLLANRMAGNFPQGDTFQGRRGTVVSTPMNQPMGMGSVQSGAIPQSAMDLRAAIMQARNSGMMPQGDTFQNNPNRPQVSLQGALDSLRAFGSRG